MSEVLTCYESGERFMTMANTGEATIWIVLPDGSIARWDFGMVVERD